MRSRLLGTAAVWAAAAAILAAQTKAPAVIAARDATVLGFRLHYLDAGRGSTVVLLHGLGGSSARWRPNIEALATGFHVVALDQIGFGESDKPLAAYHNGMLAEFLVDFLKAIGSPSATLVGNSMGANVAMYTAIHYPQAVDRLVLVDGGGFRPAPARGGSAAPGGAAARAGAAAALRSSGASRMRQLANASTREETREYFKLLFHDDRLVTDQLVDESLALRLRSAFAIAKMMEAGEQGLGAFTEAEVRRVAAPTLIIWGRDDELIDPATADRLQAAIPGARKALVDNAGHMPQLERPDEFNDIVREFLEMSSGRRGGGR